MKLDCTVELKLDGLSIVLTYRDGRFTQVTTRSNREVGEDTTQNLMLPPIPR